MIEEMKMLRSVYFAKRQEIQKRLEEFKRVWEEGREEDIFTELVFCILTPQSKAKVCWDVVQRLVDEGLLLKGEVDEIVKRLNGVRFKNKKAEYIVRAREFFMNNDEIVVRPHLRKLGKDKDMRDWLVRNVKGMGYKEASHFLRNIGLGKALAILDRHILKNLRLFGIIERIPNALSKKKYFEIEKKMRRFAREVDIPMAHLDLLFWYKETGEIFK